MKSIFTVMLALAFICGQAQNLKFKKDVQPLIDTKDFSMKAKNTTLNFHKQNTKEDGSLTEKAIMMSWDNMVLTRVHLGQCYYILGKESKNLTYLDSSLYFLNLAQDMKSGDFSPMIKEVKTAREKMAIENKKTQAESEKKKQQEEYQLMYGEKTITAVYTGGEFLGYCIWYFKDLQGKGYWFYNPSLGKYSDVSGCRMKPFYESDTFELTYKLGKTEIYNEDIGANEVIEKDLIQTMKLKNPKRAEQIKEQEMTKCKKTIDSLVAEIKKVNGEMPAYLNTNPESSDKCDVVVESLNNFLSNYTKGKKRVEEIAAEQKKLTASGCNSCILAVTKKFLAACVEVNGANIKASLSKCCYDANADCKHIGNERPIKYSRLVEKPEVNSAQWILDKEKDFFVYYYSENMAIVIPKGVQKGVTVVKESGTWKVLNVDEERDGDIFKYINPTK